MAMGLAVASAMWAEETCVASGRSIQLRIWDRQSAVEAQTPRSLWHSGSVNDDDSKAPQWTVFGHGVSTRNKVRWHQGPGVGRGFSYCSTSRVWMMNKSCFEGPFLRPAHKWTSREGHREHILLFKQSQRSTHLPKGEFLSQRSMEAAMKVLGILWLGT